MNLFTWTIGLILSFFYTEIALGASLTVEQIVSEVLAGFVLFLVGVLVMVLVVTRK